MRDSATRKAASQNDPTVRGAAAMRTDPAPRPSNRASPVTAAVTPRKASGGVIGLSDRHDAVEQAT